MATNNRIGYPGGKGAVGVYQSIINCMPPHETYVEPFLGAGAILCHKRPAAQSIGIDMDDTVIRKWRSASIPSLEIICGNALNLLPQLNCIQTDPRRTLVYCDPPYLYSVRRSGRHIYKRELATEAQHLQLLRILVALPCMVMLSGYRSPLYESIVGHWRQVDFFTVNRAGERTTETIWMNFPASAELHDYRYLGTNFRERERIKRKRLRWQRRFARMTELERQAVLFALQSVSSD